MVGILEQGLQRPQPQRLVLDLDDQPLPFRPGQGDIFGGDQVLDDRLDDADELLRRDFGDVGEVQAVDQLSVDRGFQLLVGPKSPRPGRSSPLQRVPEPAARGFGRSFSQQSNRRSSLRAPFGTEYSR